MGYHVIQFLLFLGRYFLFLNTYVANLACWLVSGDSLGIDDSFKIFNVDCRVSLRYWQSTLNLTTPLHVTVPTAYHGVGSSL